MNIYVFELKSQVKNVIIWTTAIIICLAVFQIGIYPMFSDSLDEILKVISGFPKSFLVAFGFDVDTMFSFDGFFNLTYSYLTLMGAIMAMVLSLSTFAREKRNKCVDFLLTKPIGRNKIFIAKLLAVLTAIVITNVFVIVSSIIIYQKADEPAKDIGIFLLGVSGLFFTQLVFVAMGVMFAVFAKKIRSISGTATAVGFCAFILSALYGILEEEFLRFVAPLKYFDAAAVNSSGSFEARYVCVAMIVIIICVGTAYTAYCKRDAHAV
ncbi:MAG: ABC transporter permease subunit [Lachnospiraceae bacterium]|nr:ABC transporter permease subunit [Lachnospiraceae bacterium]